MFSGFTMPFKIMEFAYCRICHRAVPPSELVGGMCPRCAELERKSRAWPL